MGNAASARIHRPTSPTVCFPHASLPRKLIRALLMECVVQSGRAQDLKSAPLDLAGAPQLPDRRMVEVTPLGGLEVAAAGKAQQAPPLDRGIRVAVEHALPQVLLPRCK